MDIILDFDGTCVSHEFPEIGKEIGAVPILKELVSNGHNLILFTMRSDVKKPKSNNPLIVTKGGMYLSESLNWFKKHQIPLYGIQTNPTQLSWTTSPKAYGQLHIDDASLGCPLKFDKSISNNYFVDWDRVRELLIQQKIIKL